jgi:hypothetical protein
MADINPEEFEKRLIAFEQRFLEEFPKAIHGSGLSAFEIVKRRILKFGQKADGSKTGQYSTAQIPLFYTKNGSVVAPYSSGALTQGAEDRVKALIKKKGKDAKKTLSYKEWREFNNLQTSFKDFSFSGDTWSDIGVQSFDANGSKVSMIIGPLNQINRQGKSATSEVITDSWYDQEGDILELNPEEEKVIDESIDADITRLMQEILFNAA